MVRCLLDLISRWRSEVNAVNFHLHLDTERVQHLDAEEPLCVEPEVPVRDVLERLKECQKDSILVSEGGKLVGIFTERNALQLLAAEADLDRPIRSVMTDTPVTISIHDTVGTAIHKMAVGGYRRLPMLDETGRPVGILKVPHILHYLVEHFPGFIYNLPPSPHHTTQEREGA